MKVTDGNTLMVPLYHGTSTGFLPSILAHGLGGINPHQKFSTLELLRESVEALKSHFRDDQAQIADLNLSERMLEQGVSAANFNFRHGSTYVSPSMPSAVRYAITNQSGSELLNEALAVLRKLKDAGCVESSEIENRYCEVVTFGQQKYEPVLIELSGVKISAIRTETGNDPIPVLDRMQVYVNKFGEKLAASMWQQSNFELAEAIPPNLLKIYRINWINADTVFPEYKLEPI